MKAIEWADGDIVVIDQTLLPHQLEFRTLSSTDDVAEAIRMLRVRGAPALGIIGAMGVAQAAVRTHSSTTSVVLDAAREAGARLVATRPTAVNLGWAIDRVLDKARKMPATAGGARLVKVMIDEALGIQDEDERACRAMAKHALEFFAPKAVVMTHCNTGFLCTGGYGTALGAIRYAHEEGLGVAVIATETRPLLQGARLTAWELGRLEIPHAIVVDGAAPGLIARGEVTMVIVGADRIAANGDVANKVGTYPLALAADAAGIPFLVAAPTSTIDPGTPTGAAITVEEREPAEVTSVLGALPIAPMGTSALNPAFDVTPAALITAIVTERGVARAPLERSMRSLLDGTALPRAVRPAAVTSTGRKPAVKRPAARKPAAKKPAVKRPAAARVTSGRSHGKKPAAKAKPAAKGKAKGKAKAKKPKRR